jgi:hypothetical protein
VGLSLVPVLLSALFIDRGAQSHVIVGQPSLRDLVNSLHLGMIAGFTGGASLLAHWCGWRYRGFHFLPAPLALVVGWWLCQPLGMFLFSWITGTSVFVPRYLFLSLPGAAFLATMMVAPFLPNHAWRPLAALVGVGVLLSLGSWPRPSPQHHGSQWREAAIAINEIRSMRADTPVLCPSPFVEAQPPAWSPAYSISGFLYSHLQAYPV